MTIVFVGQDTLIADNIGTIGGLASVVSKIFTFNLATGSTADATIVGDVVCGERLLSSFVSGVPLGDDFNYEDICFVFYRSNGKVFQVSVTDCVVYSSEILTDGIFVYGDGGGAFTDLGSLLDQLSLSNEELFLALRSLWLADTSRKGSSFTLSGWYKGVDVNAKTPNEIGAVLRNLLVDVGLVESDNNELASAENDETKLVTLGNNASEIINDVEAKVNVIRVPPAGGKTTLAKSDPANFADSDAILEEIGYEASKAGCLSCKEEGGLSAPILMDILAGRTLLSNFDILWMIGSEEGFNVVQTGYKPEEYVEHITTCGREDLITNFTKEDLEGWMNYTRDYTYEIGEFITAETAEKLLSK